MSLRALLTALLAQACSVETRVHAAANAVSLAHYGVPTIDVFTARDLARRGQVVLVDAREPAEIAVSRLPGAIPLADLDPHGPRPVVYCTIGERSARAVARLREQGIDAANLHGSALAWVHAGLPLVDERGAPTTRLHTWSSDWALVPDHIQAVW
jgi:sodium/bile acid cotransporter 7